MAYRGQHFGDPSNDPPEVTSSGHPSDTLNAEVGVPLPSYSAASTQWQNFQYAQGPSPVAYAQGYTLPNYGHDTSGYYATEGDWPSARTSNALDYSFPETTAGVASYTSPIDMYNYTYHGGHSDFSNTTASTPLPMDQTSSMDVDIKSVKSSGSNRHGKHKDTSSRGSGGKKSKGALPVSPSASSPGGGSGKSTSKLRSASRTSKNTHHNPPATEEERKNRASHNQVEKQYRNRLNAHFESLLSALPEHMRGSGGGGDEDDDGGGGGGGGAGDGSGDRKVSKAEVLDMARRHIQALERECAALEGERDELKENMERLRYLFGRCGGDDGVGGGPQGP
ncbi:hypothetical protein BX600DRAFT_515669 [Xylariales sp. PMI_506]|nr:hypothetical protein BX600DRAFT_515669 [Xylariales sp. PMI_506]